MTSARHEVVEETGSTNADLVALAADPARAGAWPHGSSLRARRQTAGRGRAGRAWVTPPDGALTASVLLRPRVPADRLAGIGQLAGLAVLEGLGAFGLPPLLKWPNDVVLDLPGEDLPGWGTLRKLGGLLVQGVPVAPGGDPAAADRDHAPALVVGVGLNLAQAPDELPVPWATSLAAAGLSVPDTEELWAAILDALVGRLVPAWEDAEGDLARTGDVLARLAAATTTVGRDVRVDPAGGGEPLVGRAVGLDARGRLRVRVADGAEHAVGAGDVAHLRLDV